MALTRPRLLALSLLCGALAGCAHESPSVAQLIDSGKDAQALELVRESKAAPATDPGWAKAMVYAAHAGNVELLTALLDHGADVNHPAGEIRVTPLHLVLDRLTTTIYIDAARLLLDRGADPNRPDSGGDTPLHYLAARKVIEIQAAKAAAIQLLLERGAVATVTDAGGWTPLHLSASVGDSDALLQLWLDHGAQVGVADKHGITPLDVAVTADHEPAARFLIAHGAAPRIILAGPNWPADSTDVHRQFQISGKSFALLGDWKREQGETRAARAAYETAESQLGLAVAELQRAVGAYRSAATQAENPSSGQIAASAISTAVGVTAAALTGVGWVTRPGPTDVTVAKLNALADKIDVERAATQHLLDEVQAKRASLPGS